MNETVIVSNGYDRIDGRNAYQSEIKRITIGEKAVCDMKDILQEYRRKGIQFLAAAIGRMDYQGTFNPDSNITRAEAATIFMNMIDVNKRHYGRTYGKAN